MAYLVQFSNKLILILIYISDSQWPSTTMPSQSGTQFGINQTGLGFSGTGSSFFNLQNPPLLGSKRTKQ